MKIEMQVDIKKLIEENQFKVLKELLTEQEPVKIVEMIEELESEDKVIVFRLLSKDMAANVFSELETDIQLKLLALFKEEKLRDIIEEMDPDDRAELFEELPANAVKKLLSILSPEEREQTLLLLNYPEDSAGRIMNPYYVDLKEEYTAEYSLKHIKETGNTKETIYTLFVTDKNRKLSGVAELKSIIFADESTLIKEIMNDQPVYATVYDNQETVAQIMQDYDILALPIVDSESRLIGIVTIDDVVDIIQESATEDIQKMAAMGVTETSYFHTSIWKFIKSRVFWLIVLLLLGSISGFIVQKYSAILAQITILAAFMPTITAMAGNTGSQMSAIMIRSIALGEIEQKDIMRVFLRELITGVFLGIILAVVMALRAYFNVGNPRIILSLSVSLFLVIVISNLLGFFLPFIAKKFRLDPAMISGPLISTVMDAISMTIYFSVSIFLLKSSGVI